MVMSYVGNHGKECWFIWRPSPIAWTTDLTVNPIHSTRAQLMMTNTKLTDQWSLQYTHTEQWPLNTCSINHRFSQLEQTLHYYITGLGRRNFSVALVAVELRGNWFPDLHKKANAERWIEVTKAMQRIVWQILSQHAIYLWIPQIRPLHKP